MKLTAAQRRELERAAQSDMPIRLIIPAGFRRANWLRMMKRLSDAGLLRPCIDDGFGITEAGRTALAKESSDG